MSAIEAIFWCALGVIVYAYFGYGVAIALVGLFVRRPVRRTDALPKVTLLIAAWNEEDEIGRKIENSLALDYPPERLEVLVVADGSDDRTCEVVRRYGARGVRLEWQPERRGKNHAVARAVPLATGEIIVLSDANSTFRADSLRMLVRNFGDPEVALVAGEKRILPGGPAGASGGGDTVSAGEGLYWRYESLLKRLDSRVGSVMGAAGEILAIRKDSFRAPPADVILEDFFISMSLVREGRRVVYEPGAISFEQASPSIAEEWKRKARNVAGGWDSVVRLWPLLSPTYGLASFQYVSHRVLRWVVVPFLLPLVLALNVVLALAPHAPPIYRATLAAQLALYALAAVGYALERRGRGRWRPAAIPFYFAFANYAALAGAWRYLRGRQKVTWEKAKRAAAEVRSG